MHNSKSIVLRGIAASLGIAIGKAFIYEKISVNFENLTEVAENIEAEIERFKNAVKRAEKELLSILEDLEKENAEILEVQKLILKDPAFTDEIVNLIMKGKRAEFAVKNVVEKWVKKFEEMENEYMKERAIDIVDIGERILRLLLGVQALRLSDLKEKSIIIARYLTPSDTAYIKKEFVLGIATDSGGPISHAAIIARSLGIPAVVGLKNATQIVKQNDTLIVDGNRGILIVNPDNKTLNKYREEECRFAVRKEEVIKKYLTLPAETIDGRKVKIAANVNSIGDAYLACEYGAEAVGLLRIEFLFINKSKEPSEDDIFNAIKKVLELMKGKPVIVRTLDIGGDKPLPYINMPKENNPFLGWRGIRLCLDVEELLKKQFRAFLRASVHGDLKIMYPFVSSIEEVKLANRILEEVKRELKEENKHFNENIEIGVMIETPSAALIADKLAREVDFFSIGTNDLSQYVLAADRTNERVSKLCDHAHPAVLRLMKNVIEAAHKENLHVGVCGESSSDIDMVPILIGMGVDELSMIPLFIPSSKRIIRSIRFEDARKLVDEVLDLATAEEVRACSKKFLEKAIK